VAADEGPRLPTRLIATARRHHAGVVDCGRIAEPHHTPVWLWDGAATHEYGEWHVGVVP
jgi:hypothetical protein